MTITMSVARQEHPSEVNDGRIAAKAVVETASKNRRVAKILTALSSLRSGGLSRALGMDEKNSQRDVSERQNTAKD